MSKSLSSQLRPPRAISGFLAWSLPTAIKEPVLGDLEEAFGDKYHQYGLLTANLWYLRQALFSGFSFMLQTQRSVVMFILAIIFFLLMTLFAMYISSGVSLFIDIPSFLIVFPPALILTCAATSYNEVKRAFAMLMNVNHSYDNEHCKRSALVFSTLGNTGLMLGIFMMLIGIIAIGNVIESFSSLAPALAVAMLSLFYGVAIKLVSYVAQQKMISLDSGLKQ